MSQFRIKTQAPDGSEPVLLYDNQTSSLTWEDGRPIAPVQPRQFGDAAVVSVDQPGLKGVIKTLKVSLGLSCNYECNYCSQRFVPHTESSNPSDIEPFVAKRSSFKKMQAEIAQFFDESNQSLYAVELRNSPKIIADLVQLSKELRACERGV
jgi:sulfatase maturation enzyme AslB (radical SAM superfamily)